jgi:hypothetical protein
MVAEASHQTRLRQQPYPHRIARNREKLASKLLAKLGSKLAEKLGEKLV